MTPAAKSFAVLACSLSLLVAERSDAGDIYETSAGPVSVEPMVEGLDAPWAFVFLPGGDLLITEKGGAMRVFRGGELSAPLANVPEVADSGQGGLLDVALAADFETSGEIYFSYAASAGFFASQTRVARARLALDGAPRLEDVTEIFSQEPAQRGGRHFGSRIVVADDGSLFVTIGDRGEREEAQNPARHQGSVVRILRDGAPHPENPFVGDGRGWKPEIYSYGHRNQQGAVRGPGGALWTVEHGARGGDEINRPEMGKNYGWPAISYGRHYSGARIGVGTEAAGMEQPKYYWDPSIAPSGMAYYDADAFPEWKGDLFVGALKYEMLVRLDVEDGEIVGEERLFADEFGRVRDVRQGPDGAIWFATDQNGGTLHRVVAAD